MPTSHITGKKPEANLDGTVKFLLGSKGGVDAEGVASFFNNQDNIGRGGNFEKFAEQFDKMSPNNKAKCVKALCHLENNHAIKIALNLINGHVDFIKEHNVLKELYNDSNNPIVFEWLVNDGVVLLSNDILGQLVNKEKMLEYLIKKGDYRAIDAFLQSTAYGNRDDFFNGMKDINIIPTKTNAKLISILNFHETRRTPTPKALDTGCYSVAEAYYEGVVVLHNMNDKTQGINVAETVKGLGNIPLPQRAKMLDIFQQEALAGTQNSARAQQQLTNLMTASPTLMAGEIGSTLLRRTIIEYKTKLTKNPELATAQGKLNETQAAVAALSGFELKESEIQAEDEVLPVKDPTTGAIITLYKAAVPYKAAVHDVLDPAQAIAYRDTLNETDKARYTETTPEYLYRIIETLKTEISADKGATQSSATKALIALRDNTANVSAAVHNAALIDWATANRASVPASANYCTDQQEIALGDLYKGSLAAAKKANVAAEGAFLKAKTDNLQPTFDQITSLTKSGASIPAKDKALIGVVPNDILALNADGRKLGKQYKDMADHFSRKISYNSAEQFYEFMGKIGDNKIGDKVKITGYDDKGKKTQVQIEVSFEDLLSAFIINHKEAFGFAKGVKTTAAEVVKAAIGDDYKAFQMQCLTSMKQSYKDNYISGTAEAEVHGFFATAWELFKDLLQWIGEAFGMNSAKQNIMLQGLQMALDTGTMTPTVAKELHDINKAAMAAPAAGIAK